MQKKLFIILAGLATVFTHCWAGKDAGKQPKEKSPILRLLCKKAGLKDTYSGSAFVVKYNEKYYIITATSNVLAADFSANVNENHMFVKPLNSKYPFHVCPKQSCAVDDVCVLSLYSANVNMDKILATTQVYELMSPEEFTTLTGGLAAFTPSAFMQKLVDAFLATKTEGSEEAAGNNAGKVKIIGCDARNTPAKALSIDGQFDSINERHLLGATNPTLRFKGQVFGGFGGGPILKGNKVCGLASDFWDMQIADDGNIMPTAVGITESPHLQSIFKAIELFDKKPTPFRILEKTRSSIFMHNSFSEEYKKMSPEDCANQEAFLRQDLAAGATASNDLLDMFYIARDVDKALLRKNFAYVFGLEQFQKILDKTRDFLNSDVRFEKVRRDNGLPETIPALIAPNTDFTAAQKIVVGEAKQAELDDSPSAGNAITLKFAEHVAAAEDKAAKSNAAEEKPSAPVAETPVETKSLDKEKAEPVVAAEVVKPKRRVEHKPYMGQERQVRIRRKQMRSEEEKEITSKTFTRAHAPATRNRKRRPVDADKAIRTLEAELDALEKSAAVEAAASTSVD